MWNGFHDMNGWGWLMMAFGIVFWVAVVAFAVWAISHLSGRGPGRPESSSPRELLDLRLARGEITIEEHTRALDALARGRVPR